MRRCLCNELCDLAVMAGQKKEEFIVVITVPTAGDLRAEVARKQIPIYKLAARVGMHPGRLGMMLSGRLPLPEALTRRVCEAIEEMSDE